MNILKFFKSLITPNLEQNCNGTYNFVSINNTTDIKILINQIKSLPYQTHIDTDWIIKSLKSISSDPVILENKIKELENAVEIQCRDGNWNFDPYMHGMANGMIFSLSLLKNEESEYLDAPASFIYDDKNKINYEIDGC